MSYCRFSDADIYVYPSMGGFECCGCPVGKFFSTKSAADMLRHMKAHRDAGLDVPDYAFLGVFQDRNEYRNPPATFYSRPALNEAARLKRELADARDSALLRNA